MPLNDYRLPVAPLLRFLVQHKVADFRLVLEDVGVEGGDADILPVVVEVVAVRHPAPRPVLLNGHVAVVVLDAVVLHALRLAEDFIF